MSSHRRFLHGIPSISEAGLVDRSSAHGLREISTSLQWSYRSIFLTASRWTRWSVAGHDALVVDGTAPVARCGRGRGITDGMRANQGVLRVTRLARLSIG